MSANCGRTTLACVAVLSIVFLPIPGTSNAEPWQRFQAGTTINLDGVFGADSYSLAVGQNGTLTRFDGSQWSLVQTPTVLALNAVWARSSSDAFIVGSNGTILHYDGVSATRALSVTSANLRGVWGTSDGVFAVGDNGTVLQYDGSAWSLVPHITSRRLRAVGSSGDRAAVAVGDNGAILRYDGSEWSVENTPTTLNLHGVWVASPDRAFAVGSFGTVLQYDGNGWAVMETPTTLNLNAVWGFSSTQVYAVGEFGTILEYDGRTWSRVENVTTLNLTAINNGFVVGDFGTVLRNPGTLVEINNLRISEVDPRSGQVEVTNEGPAFTSGDHPFSHRDDVSSSVTPGSAFAAGGIQVYEVSNLTRSDSDLWLYRRGPFDDINNIVHGVKYGAKANVGQTSLAVDAGLWASTDAYTPVPPGGMSLAYDGFGNDPKDWYVDETPSFGSRDVTEVGRVQRQLEFPRGLQDFEAVSLGDEIIAIADWSVVGERNVRGIFTARVVSDVMGAVTPSSASTRWLRIRDQDAGPFENVVATPTIVSTQSAYAWTFHINIEERSVRGGQAPAIMVQHARAGVFVSTWGIEFGDDDVHLVVTDAGGDADRIRLAGIDEFVGEWTRVNLLVSPVDGFMTIAVDGTSMANLPIDPDSVLAADLFRLAYVGSGRDNTGTILLDRISIEAEAVAVPFAVNAKAIANDNTAVITWATFGPGTAVAFNVYRRVDDGAELHHAGPLATGVRSLSDADLDRDHTYTYVVAAIKADGSETRSAVSKVRIEPRPVVVFGELRAVTTEASVLLLWKLDVLQRIDGFRIYRRASDEVDDVRVTGGFLLPVSARYYTDEVATTGRTYFYTIAAVRPDGTEIRSGWTTVSVQAPSLQITNIYPNPFTVSTTISLSLPEEAAIDVSVYNVQGKRVAILPSRTGAAGRNVVNWDGRDSSGRSVSAGTYFLKVKSAGETMTRKVVIVH